MIASYFGRSATGYGVSTAAATGKKRGCGQQSLPLLWRVGNLLGLQRGGMKAGSSWAEHRCGHLQEARCCGYLEAGKEKGGRAAARVGDLLGLWRGGMKAAVLGASTGKKPGAAVALGPGGRKAGEQ
ncbi:hypothetical protein E2562_033818 [Oryza meyeriana var. granulata]|uniref:Uncharacterized protein n=1 Tax=Oryza meyeriana var. granulata TaxID=110450 RepID=A0A6G1F173_9ORYZ|nr:hypothetical protein E2562_033818 [Oryza meyeriana var. granulata]